MSFDAMPNEMLDIIFNQNDFPMQERIKLRAISPRCLTVIEDGFKKETKLTITEVQYSKKFREPKTLYLLDAKYLTADLFQLFGRLFTAVEKLSLITKSDEFFGQLAGLLPQFSATLKTLKLNCEQNHQYPREALTRTANAINSLTNLTRLSLDADNLHVFFLIILAPTLARLERFAVDDFELNENGLIGSDRRYDLAIFASLTDRCTNLELNSADFYWSGTTNVDASLTDLRLVCAGRMEITKIGQRMPSLRHLKVSFGKMDIKIGRKKLVHLSGAIFRDLSALTQLVDLRLESFSYDAKFIQLPSATDQPLSTVKRLHLEKNSDYIELIEVYDAFGRAYNRAMANKAVNFNGNKFCKALAAWFPGLEQLTIEVDEKYYYDDINKNLQEFPSSVDVQILYPGLWH